MVVRSVVCGCACADSEGVWLRDCVLGIDLPMPIYFRVKDFGGGEGVDSG
jgi:hypothetical protein